MNSFQNVKRQFGLNNDDFFRFLQVHHHVEQIRKEIKQEQWDKILVKVFTDVYVSGPGQKIISRLFKGLQQMKGSSLHVKQKWEGEGNLVLSKEDWEYLCEIQWKTSNSTLRREFCWKTLIRFFITPAQKRHYSNSAICWRQCGCLKANHFHIFWSCSLLLPYCWQEVIHNSAKKCFRQTLLLSLYHYI